MPQASVRLGQVSHIVLTLLVLLTTGEVSTVSALQNGATTGIVEGTAADDSGAMLPGVLVEITPVAPPARRTRTAQTDAEGHFRIDQIAPGEYWVQLTLAGFGHARERVQVTGGATATVAVKLAVEQLSEQVRVTADPIKLEKDRATQTVTFSNEVLNQVPTASRSYTHVIVAEAGVSAPLPDRTGKGLTITYPPGAQAEDSSQSLNPSINGARPTNNSMRVNGVDTTNMMNTAGGLGQNVGIPLDALEEVSVQTALVSASQGRNGGGNIELVTRAGTDRFSGTGAYYWQHEQMNANEYFLNAAGTQKPKFRRNDTSGTLGGPVLPGRTYFFGSAQNTRFLSGYAGNAIARTGLPTGLTDVRTRESIANVANEWLRTGAQDNPQFAANFLAGLRAFPAEQVPGLLAKFFTNVQTLQFRELTAQDIHPVAVNILNVQRDGKFLIPSPDPSTMQYVPNNPSYGREYQKVEVVPTENTGWSGFLSLQHRFSQSNQTRFSYVQSRTNTNEAFGWSAASPSPTFFETPSTLAGVANNHTFGSNLLQELSVGYFTLENTRRAKYHDLLNSSLGIYNPLEEHIGGLAAMMPTIDINTSGGSSGGIGNAWDYYDKQTTYTAAGRWSLIAGSHTLQSGFEYRRTGIDGEYMARTNGDLDYGNWVLFFTGHGAAGGGSDLDQGDTRRNYRVNDFGAFLQDDWRIGGGVTLNAGVRYDIYGNFTDTRGFIGNYYLPDAARELGVQPGFQVPANSPFLRPDFNPLMVGIYVDPGTPWNLDQFHEAPYESTVRPDLNNISPRLGMAWQPSFAKKFVLRGGWGVYYERMSGTFKSDLQTSAPYFILQNVPAPQDMANPYPHLNVNPFQIPLNVTFVRDANGVPSWRKFDGSTFPASEPFNPKSNTFIDPLIRTPYTQQWSVDVQYQASKELLFDIRYVGSRGTDLLGKVNLSTPLDPRVTPVNGFTDIYTRTGALVAPAFLVPSEFLGLTHNTGFQQLTNIARSNYHALQMNVRGRFTNRGQFQLGYTFGKTLDTLSSDRGLIEQNPRDPENNYGPADFDRTHRLTTAFVLELPAFGSRGGRLSSPGGLVRAVTQDWRISGFYTYQSGTPFTMTGAGTANAIFAQVSRARPSLAPGKSMADAYPSAGQAYQDRLLNWFDPNIFVNSGDQWGNLGRNTLRGPSQMQLDLNVARVFRLFDRHRLELRWEIFNALNMPVFSNPAAALSAAGVGTSGRITSTIGGPRTMQLAARYMF